MDFGVFVRLEPGVEGLVHVSELVAQASLETIGRGERRPGSRSAGPLGRLRAAAHQPVDEGSDRPMKPGQEKKADEDLPLPAGASEAPRK